MSPDTESDKVESNIQVSDRQCVSNLVSALTSLKSTYARDSLLHSTLQGQSFDETELLRLSGILVNRKFISQAKAALDYCDSHAALYPALRARLAYFEKDYPTAIANWKLAIRDPSTLVLPDYFRLMDACEKTQNIKLLFQIATEVQSFKDLSEIQIRQLATIYFRNNKISQSIQTLDKLSSIDDLSTYLVATRIYSAGGQNQLALDTITEAEIRFVRKSSDAPVEEQQRLLQWKLRVLMDLDRCDEVIVHSKHMMTKYPDYFPAYQTYLRALRKVEDRAGYFRALSST